MDLHYAAFDPHDLDFYRARQKRIEIIRSCGRWPFAYPRDYVSNLYEAIMFTDPELNGAFTPEYAAEALVFF